jgi:hypothetical protein
MHKVTQNSVGEEKVLVISMPGKEVPERRSGLRTSEKELPERRCGAFLAKVLLHKYLLHCILHNFPPERVQSLNTSENT